MGDDPSLVKVQTAVALIAVLVSIALAALAWTRRQRATRQAIGVTLLVFGAVATPLAGVVGLLPASLGFAVLVASWQAPRE